MKRVLLLFLAAVTLPLVPAQPVSCKEDAQCSDGYFCEADAHICRECLSCQDLKRKPLSFSTCIKSVSECGPCNKGLVVDRNGDVNAECVPPDTSQLDSTPNTTQVESTPYYVWLLIGFGILLFLVIVVGIIAYLLRYPEIFKIAGSNPSSTVTAHITASAPEAPPPYNQLPQAPYSSPPYSDVESTAYNEDEQFIKRPAHRPQDSRVSDGNQAARVYDKPIYERELLPPTSPESPLPEYTDTMTLPIDDEDTMPSPWTPSGAAANGDINDNGASESNGAVALPALLAAARDTTLVEHSAPKKRRVRQDSNNNRNRESNSCGDGGQSSFPRSPSPSQGGPPYSFVAQINVVQINNTK